MIHSAFQQQISQDRWPLGLFSKFRSGRFRPNQRHLKQTTIADGVWRHTGARETKQNTLPETLEKQKSLRAINDILDMNNKIIISLLVIIQLCAAMWPNSAHTEIFRNPYNFMHCTKQKTHCAVARLSGSIELYSMENNAYNMEPKYIIPEWAPIVFFSENGEFLVTIKDAVVDKNMLTEPIIKIYREGNLKKSYSPLDIIPQPEMQTLSNGVLWGNPIGNTEHNMLKIQSLSGREYLVDISAE